MSLTSNQVQTIRNTFAAVAPRADEIVSRFYERLFTSHPEVRSMFPEDMKAQRNHLKGAIGLVVKNADRLGEIVPQLEAMGARHVAYGTQPEHYPVVRDELLGTLAEFAGDAWTSEVEKAWATALNAVATVMLSGAAGAQSKAA